MKAAKKGGKKITEEDLDRMSSTELKQIIKEQQRKLEE